MAEKLRDPSVDPLAASTPSAEKHRENDHRQQEQDHDEPEVADPEAAVVVASVLDVVDQEVTAGQVVPEGTSVARVEAATEPGLGWDQHQKAEQERDQ